MRTSVNLNTRQSHRVITEVKNSAQAVAVTSYIRSIAKRCQLMAADPDEQEIRDALNVLGQELFDKARLVERLCTRGD